MNHSFEKVPATTLADDLSGVPWIAALAAQDDWPSPFVAEYPFGSAVFQDGKYLAPCASTSSLCPGCQELVKALSGHELVFACGVDPGRGLEVFVPGPAPAPLRMLARAEPFGLFELLDRIAGNRPSSAWTVSAGARSWYFLNRMGDARITRGFNARFKGCTPPYPSTDDEKDDWHRVLAVARAASDWRVRVAFFPVPTSAKPEAVAELYKLAWDQSTHLRDAASDTTRLRHVLSRKRSKRVPQYLPTLGYLLGSTRGHLPVMGLAAAFHEFHGPTAAIAEVLGELHPRHNFVHVLAPIHLSRDGSAGFYSFTHPPHPSLVKRDEVPALIRSDWDSLWNITGSPKLVDCFDDRWSLDFVQAGKSMRTYEESIVAPILAAMDTLQYTEKCGADAMKDSLVEAMVSPFFNAAIVLRRQ